MSSANQQINGSKSWERAMAAASWVAIVFCAVVTIAIAVTTFNARKYDPLATTLLENKLLALNRDPKNETLRLEARKLDLQIRQTYFQRQAFAVNGFYLILAGAAVFFLANEARKAIRRSVPLPKPSSSEFEERTSAGARRSVAVLGVLLGGGLITLAAVSRHDSAAEYAKKAIKPAKKVEASASTEGTQPDGQGGTALQPLAPPGISGPIGSGLPSGGGTLNSGSTSGGTNLEPVKGSGGGATTKAAQPSAQPIEAYVQDSLKNDWPSFRGPGGIGVALNAKPMTDWSPTSNILWKAKIDLPGWNSPIVIGGKVFFTGADKTKRTVYCFNAINGDELWRKDVPSTTKEAPQVLDDTGYAPSTMASDGQRVFAIFPNGDVYGFDLEGKQLWQKALGMPSNVYGHATSLVVYGSGLLIQFDQGTAPEDGKSKLIALECATGKVAWEVKRPVAGSWSTPMVIKVGGKEQIITTSNPLAIAYDAASGNELWRVECLSGDVAPSPAFGSGFVHVANLGSYMSALRPDLKGDISKTGIGWQSQDDLPDITSLLCHDDLLYLLTTEGVLTCVDAKTGKKVWNQNYNERFNASPIFADGKIYLMEISGKAHILEAGRAYKEVASPSIGEEVRATPAFVSDRIYIRGKQHLFCIGGL